MAFLRTGVCNRCGECCGYPRATDGGQNNPWPPDWPQSIQNWTPESIATYLPVLQFVTNMVNTPNGNFTIRGNRCYWIWVLGKGLCTDLPPYGDPTAYDQRCPLLDAKQPDNTVPCLAVGTRYQLVYDVHCEPVPPYQFEKQEQIDNWYANCPSCSYIYVAG